MLDNSLSAESISSNLKTRFVGHRVIYYSTLDSTMTAGRKEARRGAVEGTVVIAEEQTAGRGRRERIWLSPQGGIALSIILRPTMTRLPSLIMIASLAVVYSIKDVTGLKAQIKWPNDVLIKNRKVCGILIENGIRGEKVDYSVIGIGINVNLRLPNFPEIQPIATSLSDETGKSVSRLEMTRHLLTEFERLYLLLQKGGSVYEQWCDNLVTLGKKVTVKTGKATLEGIAEAVDRDGSLLLRKPDGSLERIVAGDVTLRTLA